MKKIFLFVGILAASMGMVSCNEDYTDWADPQKNGPEDPQGSVSATISAVSSEIKYETASDAIELVQFQNAANAKEGTTVKFSKIVINETEAIEFEQEGNNVIVTKEALATAVRNIYQSQAAVTRELSIVADLYVVGPEGEAVPCVAGPVKVNYTPAPLPASTKDAAFYYIGTSQGWDMSNCTPLSDNGDGTWSATITVGNSDWFKFIPQSAVDAADWAGLYGCEVNGSTASSDFIKYEGEAMMVEMAGTYIFTLDVVNFTYSVIPAKALYFIVGTPNGWSNTLKSAFYPTTVMEQSYTAYFTGAYDVKIWKSDFFSDWDNIIGAGNGDNSVTGSLVTVEPGAFSSPEAGYYTVKADFASMTYEWVKLGNQSPTEYTYISLAGDFNSWGNTDMTKVANNNTHNWYISNLEIAEDTKFKFKADHDWAVNWGSDVDLTKTYFGTGAQNGADMVLPAGTYNIYFNDITGQFVVEAL
ncbi:MAG: DUF5115 domain-containing protein [Muribaculaceae bacterium]